jgi:hypothetical protein
MKKEAKWEEIKKLSWLLKTIRMMANAGSRLCVFVHWCFSLGLSLLVLYSVAPVLEMKER